MNKNNKTFLYHPLEYLAYIFIVPVILEMIFSEPDMSFTLHLKYYFIQVMYWWLVISFVAFLFNKPQDHRYKLVARMSFPAVVILATITFYTPVAFVIDWFLYNLHTYMPLTTIFISIVSLGVAILYWKKILPWLFSRKQLTLNAIARRTAPFLKD